jgi:uncharacterized membrane protein
VRARQSATQLSTVLIASRPFDSGGDFSSTALIRFFGSIAAHFLMTFILFIKPRFSENEPIV